MEHFNEISFNVPLSGSKLFDMHTVATARGLCAKFPGLEYDYSDPKTVRIYGKLNDYWLGEFHKAVFDIGETYRPE